MRSETFCRVSSQQCRCEANVMFLCLIRRSHAEKVAAPLLLITNGGCGGELVKFVGSMKNKRVYTCSTWERLLNDAHLANLMYATSATDRLLTRNSKSRSRRDTHTVYLYSKKYSISSSSSLPAVPLSISCHSNSSSIQASASSTASGLAVHGHS